MTAKHANGSRKPTTRNAKPAKKAASKTRQPRLARTKAIDAPFAPKVLAEARDIVSGYRFIIGRFPEDEGAYRGTTIEFPEIVGFADTIEACYQETFDLLVTTVAAMLEQGQQPPAPASARKRDQQVNIRLSADEKFRLEEAARRDGFRSLSDFMRAAAVARAT